jgi:hypothetical protein
LDFTIKTYRLLLESLVRRGYAFQTFAEFLEKPAPRSIILRHDVEARYGNALILAQIQNESKIRGSYYFRFLPDHFDKEIIKEIASLGHEIGYHYDDLSHCHGNFEEAFRRFEKNLATLREIAPVTTICMEGAPLSKWDNRDLWRNANYKDYGIIGEPYFDIDFSNVFYLTDTGRRWDGNRVSVRDKVGSLQLAVRSTSDIISMADRGLLPSQIMFTFHPQRWTDKPFPWFRELVMQNVKNVVKGLVVRW